MHTKTARVINEHDRKECSISACVPSNPRSKQLVDEIEATNFASLPHTNSSSSLAHEPRQSCDSSQEISCVISACKGWLSKALSMARPGQTIYVPQGVYTESCTLSLSVDGVKIKPERRNGEDAQVTFVVEGRRDFLRSSGLGCAVSGIKFTHVPDQTATESETEDCRSAMTVVGGSLQVEECSFEELSCYAIHVRRKSKTNVIACKFSRCKEVAIACQDASVSRVFDCVFDGNLSFSIWLSGQGGGEFVSNFIKHNNKCAIVCADESRGNFRNNVITRGNQGAFWLQDSSSCRLERNVMSKNRKAAVQVSGRSDPVLIRNKVVDGEGGGIVLHDEARGSFIGNFFAYGTRAGVGVMDAAAPLFVGNEISCNDGGGVIVAGRGQPVFIKNLVKRNGFVGCCFKEDSTPLLQENEITENNGFGLLLQGNAKACVQDGSIVNNVRTGASLFDCAALTLAGCCFRTNDKLCQRIGVHLHDSSGMQMEKCKMTGHGGSCVKMEGSSMSAMRSNELSCSSFGLTMSRKASASLEGNQIVNCGEDGVMLSDQAEMYACRNSFNDNRGSGVKSVGSSVCLLQHNVLMGNGRGASLSSLGQCIVRGNRISDNSVCGLHVRGSNVTVMENAMFGEQERVLSFGEKARCDVIGNVLMHKNGVRMSFPSDRSEDVFLRDNALQFPPSDEGKVLTLSSLPRHFLAHNVAVTSKTRELIDCTLDLIAYSFSSPSSSPSPSPPVKLQILNPDGSSCLAVRG
ncbi:hypothetical protein GUITHDRAFT_101061 [Guillardia theta CCMP2712]|uniref:Right handed beta helix domain-containing protein n=1 Tax=Guillardia theta (strain CCMP2712) TaxID=905079 RepID=L1JYC8_GUITC|nr:hypothetical protein GUITHDRAFT_101061 [Guillardia theta CCMP2712]EKX53357.1 hypothetical protein GUITHDRAFT_101061 [Guillardia theta CCMP2712]|eukprot:XP_005840337.1 hypothetical protein GUITHDRAFT_101061 [Guillardia theta CCMP2712]